MTSTWSLFVEILAVIVVTTVALTLIAATFSYIGYKIRQRRKPQETEEIPNFFWRFTPEMFLAAPAREALPAGRSGETKAGNET